MASIALRVIDLYGLWLLLRWYLRLQRYWWTRDAGKGDEDES